MLPLGYSAGVGKTLRGKDNGIKENKLTQNIFTSDLSLGANAPRVKLYENSLKGDIHMSTDDKISSLKKCVLELMFAMEELSADLRPLSHRDALAHRNWAESNFADLKKAVKSLEASND